ncbi:hypothetical protein LJK88_49995 [Paenibacillus sp. P26]|nr:hypothetical protein LJK88_49995 [Paenibacillus sp. P26]
MSNENPMMLSFPESFETGRLLIRSPLYGDGLAVNQAIHESIEELRPWMPWAQSLPAPEETELNIRKARISFMERTDLRLLLFHKESGNSSDRAAFTASTGHHGNSKSAIGSAPPGPDKG